MGATVYPAPIVAPVPTAQGSSLLKETAVTMPVIGCIVAIPTAVTVGASIVPDVVIATVGAVLYALPVVLKAIEPGSMDVPVIPIVAAATLVPGWVSVTPGTLV